MYKYILIYMLYISLQHYIQYNTQTYKYIWRSITNPGINTNKSRKL